MRGITPSPVLQLDSVSVSLGGNTILADVTAEMESGQAQTLMGANGSGKSTLVRAILGLVPHRGSIRLFGTPSAQFRSWSRIGYVPQRTAHSLQIATVQEVVTLGRLAHRRPLLPPPRADRQIVLDAIERVGLARKRKEEFGDLSGGQQQRVLIARALATQPDLLILDEPLAGIDMPTQSSLATLLTDLKTSGVSMLVVLHELGPLAPLLDHALVLRHGRVVHDGSPGSAIPDHHFHHDHPSSRPSLIDGNWTTP